MNDVNSSGGSRLSEKQIQDYWTDGVVYPLTAMAPSEAESLIPSFEHLSQRMSGWTNAKQILKAHLVSKWVYELSCNRCILDAVESVLGPNILVWGATFFAKQPRKASHVGWHQDLLYWGLKPQDGVLTVWLGLTDARSDNGAMQVIRGSHRQGTRLHENRPDESNMLMSSQRAQLSDEDEKARVTVELSAGQFSMHHSMLLHGSGPNPSNWPRIGLSINYLSTDVAQTKNDGVDTAMLVRGVDHHGHFELEAPPQAEFSPQSIAKYRKSIVMPSGLATMEDLTESIINFENIV